MSDYETYPAVNSNYEFPPQVQEAISQSEILRQHFAYLNEGVLEVDGQPIDSLSDASLNKLGIARAIFLEEEEPLPSGLPDYTMVIRLPET